MIESKEVKKEKAKPVKKEKTYTKDGYEILKRLENKNKNIESIIHYRKDNLIIKRTQMKPTGRDKVGVVKNRAVGKIK